MVWYGLVAISDKEATNKKRRGDSNMEITNIKNLWNEQNALRFYGQ